MLRRILKAIFVFVLLASGTVAKAYVGPPILMPSHPKAGELVKVEVVAGICDGFAGAEDDVDVTQSGNRIEMMIESIHVDDFDWCVLPLEVTYHFWVGKLPAGNYDLSVARSYKLWSGPIEVKKIGDIAFSVEDVGASIDAIPAVSDGALAILGILLVGAATIFGFCRPLFGKRRS